MFILWKSLISRYFNCNEYLSDWKCISSAKQINRRVNQLQQNVQQNSTIVRIAVRTIVRYCDYQELSFPSFFSLFAHYLSGSVWPHFRRTRCSHAPLILTWSFHGGGRVCVRVSWHSCHAFWQVVGLGYNFAGPISAIVTDRKAVDRKIHCTDMFTCCSLLKEPESSNGILLVMSIPRII